MNIATLSNPEKDMREELDVNQLRALTVELSRLLDPREHSSLPALFAAKDDSPAALNTAGQAVEKAMRVVEEVVTDVKRIANAMELQAIIAFRQSGHIHGPFAALDKRTAELIDGMKGGW